MSTKFKIQTINPDVLLKVTVYFWLIKRWIYWINSTKNTSIVIRMNNFIYSSSIKWQACILNFIISQLWNICVGVLFQKGMPNIESNSDHHLLFTPNLYVPRSRCKPIFQFSKGRNFFILCYLAVSLIENIKINIIRIFPLLNTNTTISFFEYIYYTDIIRPNKTKKTKKES